MPIFAHTHALTLPPLLAKNFDPTSKLFHSFGKYSFDFRTQYTPKPNSMTKTTQNKREIQSNTKFKENRKQRRIMANFHALAATEI